MCGFVGIINKQNREITRDELKKMTDIITHRGPDDEGFYIEPPVGLGFRRLSIIDLAHGRQPLANESEDVWIVFNGEIYNYQELQVWLKEKGHQFKTNSDTETIVHLYEEVGFDCPNYLRGMFSFLIWDRRKDLVFGARDFFGIKPLYWMESAKRFSFASEIKSLLETEEVVPEVSLASFHHYLTFQYVPDPSTMFQGIKKVLPGQSFIIKNGNISFTQYWKPQFLPDEGKPFSYFVEKTKELLAESVKYHRISDVPKGAFLSSGVDSSSIVGLLSQHEQVKTYSVGFNIPGFSELDYAKRTAQFYGTEHNEIVVDAKEYLDHLPQLVWHLDEPLADPSAIGLYFVAKKASEQIKVVLSGEGADEFFGGYNIYREPKALFLFSLLPEKFRKQIGKFAGNLPESVKGRNYLIRASKSLEERYFGNAMIFEERLKDILLQSKVDYQSPQEVTRRVYQEAMFYDDETKMQFLDLHTWLPGNILMKADKMTMANSLELRVPFIDRKLFDLASTIPTKYKLAKGTTKLVLREAMKEILPKEIHFKRKLGFPVPISYWLRNDFYSWAKGVINDTKVDHLIHKDFALVLLEEHKTGQKNNARKIWTLLNFMLWHQTYIEKIR